MTDWGVPDDEINPLAAAPITDSDDGFAAVSHDDADAATADRGDIAAEYSDATGSVTLCVDADNVLVALRLSNNWQNAGKGRDVETLIAAAALRLPVPPLPDGPDMVRPTMPTIDPRRLLEADYFDDNLMTRVEASFRDLAEPVDPDEPGFRDRVDFTPATGESTNRKVTVTLGRGKRFESCRIDAKWSSGARAERIVATFMEAHDRAVAAYVDPVVIPGRGRERVRKARALSQMTLDLLAGRGPDTIGKDSQ